MKFADPREKFESLCFKPTTQRSLKHKVPSVSALVLIKSSSVNITSLFNVNTSTHNLQKLTGSLQN